MTSEIPDASIRWFAYVRDGGEIRNPIRSQWLDGTFFKCYGERWDPAVSSWVHTDAVLRHVYFDPMHLEEITREQALAALPPEALENWNTGVTPLKHPLG